MDAFAQCVFEWAKNKTYLKRNGGKAPRPDYKLLGEPHVPICDTEDPSAYE